jgi:hypothetical protein
MKYTLDNNEWSSGDFDSIWGWNVPLGTRVVSVTVWGAWVLELADTITMFQVTYGSCVSAHRARVAP